MLAIILGSGLTNFIKKFEVLEKLNYSDILENQITKLEGHERIAYRCFLNNKQFIVLSGKIHSYELDHNTDTFKKLLSIVFSRFEIKSCIITSASGALNNKTKIGQWSLVKNIIQAYPFLKTITYNSNFQKDFANNQVKSYAHYLGPSLGTKAEYLMYQKLGADLIGMSNLNEYEVCLKHKINTIILSIPVCQYDLSKNIIEPSHEEVIRVSQSSLPELINIFNLIFESHLCQN